MAQHPSELEFSSDASAADSQGIGCRIVGLPFGGVHEKVPVDFFIGWTVLYNEPYASATRAEHLQCAPEGAIVAVAAASCNSGDAAPVLDVAAVGQGDVVLQSSSQRRLTQHNGAWWYLEPGRAFGFSSEPFVQRRSGGADTADGDERLSWHLDGNGGFRAGGIQCLTNEVGWHKVVLCKAPRTALALALKRAWRETSDDSFGHRFEIHAIDGSLHAHACILCCRAPALYSRACQGCNLQLLGVQITALQDLVSYLYCEHLPWDPVDVTTSSGTQLACLKDRVHALMTVAVAVEVVALARVCNAWLVVNTMEIPSATQMLLPHVVTGEAFVGIARGEVVGGRTQGAVLAADLSKLLASRSIELDGCPPDCTLVLGNVDGCSRCLVDAAGRGCPSCGCTEVQAHSLILSARSSFFEAAFKHDLQERQSHVVRLGFLADLGLWEPGEAPTAALSALTAVLRFLYTGEACHVVAEDAIDVLAILETDFLQVPDADTLRQACEDAINASLTIEAAAVVAARAHKLGHAQAKADVVTKLTGMLASMPWQSGLVHSAFAAFPKELLLDLLDALAASVASRTNASAAIVQPKIQKFMECALAQARMQ